MFLQQPTATTPGLRFDAMDGLRGLAAMAVMLDHFTLHRRVPGAWTVVDLFFILSGFVVCHGYGAKISRGMSFVAFMGSRIRRLAPLYWIGSLMGALSLWLALLQRPELHLSLTSLLRATVMGLLMIPDLSGEVWPQGTALRTGMLFPLDPPAWTTFFQLFVNVCFFWGLSRWRLRWALPLTLCALVALEWLEWRWHMVNPGWGQASFIWGFPRALVEFAVGMALYRLRDRIPLVSPWLALLPMLCFMALFPLHNNLVGLLNVTVFAPLAVLLAARTRLPQAAAGVCKWLGDLSYPLYICHVPVWGLVLAVPGFLQLGGATQTGLACLAALACATALSPVDKAIRRRWLARQARSAPGLGQPQA
jgi:peptidoglycan/LPS O-acetylase OafA/YrhL